ncbi:MAG: redoxin family protein [Xanthomonadaceae bacterium]|nr:redoxin family protein [Xanthomonadaceae bacterium]
MLALAAPGAVDERVDASMFCEDPAQSEDWGEAPRLIVLMPARSEYGSMLRLAFGAYFRRGHALPQSVSHERFPRTVFVTGSDATEDDGFPMLMGDHCMPSKSPEALARIAQATGVELPKSDRADATVLLVDKDGIVRWRDDAFRAQGEHLKPLEAAVKSLLGVADTVAPAPAEDPPEVGDAAPDFVIDMPQTPPWARRGGGSRVPAEDTRLSALRGKVVVLSFYPAAFSGTLPLIEGDAEEIAVAARDRERKRMMSCAIQLDELDALAPDHALLGDVVKLAVSASTPELLDAWRRTLRTRDLHYVNDADYGIARRYGSYDAKAGYNLRKVFVIDGAGRVAYVDEDYRPGDAGALSEAIARAARN